MKSLFLASALSLLATTAFAQTAKPASNTAIERATQSANVAHCKLTWLKAGGRGSSSVAYFGHMAECLSQQASR